MSDLTKQIYAFGPYRLDAIERMLLREGSVVPLTPKAFDTLLLLVQNGGHVLSRNELLAAVWHNAIVEENTLTQNIAALRKALGQNGHRYIETVPKKGYRFVAEVQQLNFEHGPPPRPPASLPAATPALPAPVAAGATQTRNFQWTKTRRWLALTLALLGLGSVTLLLVYQAKSVPPVALRSLAVLPFQPLDAGDEDTYLGLAAAADFISQLNGYRQLRILPLSAADRYLAARPAADRAGRELGADAVLTGQIQRAGNRLTLEPQLVRVSDGARLWTKRYEGQPENFFALLTAAQAEVAAALFPNTAVAWQAHPARRPTENPLAYEAYIKGRYYWNQRTGEGLHQSLLLFEQAVAQDPHYAQAYLGLAEAYAFDGVRWREARAKAQRALELDPTLGEAHAAIGFVCLFWEWDWRAAEAEFRLAARLAPNYAATHQWYASLLALRQRGLEAQAEMRQALALDPYSPAINADQALLFYYARQYEQAIAQCQKTLALAPDFINAHVCLYYAYLLSGQYDAALAQYFKLQTLAGDSEAYFRGDEAALRKASAASGITGFWRAKIACILNDASPNHHTLAQYYALLGEQEAALAHLSRAYQVRMFGLIALPVDPVFNNLQTAPVFQKLVQRLYAGAVKPAVQ